MTTAAIEQTGRTGSVTRSRLSQSTLWICLLGCIAGMSAVVPYVVTHLARCDEPASVSVLYRHPTGDIEYFPFIAAQSRLQFKEYSIKEELGKWICSFPYVPLAVHAAGFAALGPYGFAAADLIVTLAYYILFVWLLRTVRVSPLLAAVLALLICSHQDLTVTIGLGSRTYECLHLSGKNAFPAHLSLKYSLSPRFWSSQRSSCSRAGRPRPASGRAWAPYWLWSFNQTFTQQ